VPPSVSTPAPPEEPKPIEDHDAAPLNPDGAPIAPTEDVETRVERVLRLPDDNLGEFAILAVQRFAFPLLLALLVAIFLIVQHWLDRKSPKLAFAPVHSKHDQLDFPDNDVVSVRTTEALRRV
jgi:hypothetical protein